MYSVNITMRSLTSAMAACAQDNAVAVVKWAGRKVSSGAAIVANSRIGQGVSTGAEKIAGTRVGQVAIAVGQFAVGTVKAIPGFTRRQIIGSVKEPVKTAKIVGFVALVLPLVAFSMLTCGKYDSEMKL